MATVNVIWLPPHLETHASMPALALGALAGMLYFWWRRWR